MRPFRLPSAMTLPSLRAAPIVSGLATLQISHGISVLCYGWWHVSGYLWLMVCIAATFHFMDAFRLLYWAEFLEVTYGNACVLIALS